MTSKNDISKLRIAIDSFGAIKVASALGHSTTERVQRWLRNGSIPSTQVAGVLSIIAGMQKGSL